MKTMACFLSLGLAAFVLSAHADVEITTDHSDAMYRCVEKAVFTVKVTAENGTLMTTGKVSAVVDNFGPKRQQMRTFDLAAGNPFTVGAR